MSGVEAEQGAAPPPSATKRPRERWIIGFDLCPESSPGRDSSSGSPDGRGVCHSGRDQQGERPAGGGGRGLCGRVPDTDILEFLNLLKISDSVFLLLH